MSEFATFIADAPGLTEYARHLYLLIDRQAIHVGQQLAATHGSTALRTRAGSPWMVVECRNLAEALDTDERLAAIKSLRVWATRPEGIGNTWINWYVALLKAHIRDQAVAKLKSDSDWH